MVTERAPRVSLPNDLTISTSPGTYSSKNNLIMAQLEYNNYLKVKRRKRKRRKLKQREKRRETKKKKRKLKSNGKLKSRKIRKKKQQPRAI